MNQHQQTVKKCCESLLEPTCEAALPPIAYRYLRWNELEQFQTKSIEWFSLNAVLLAELETRSLHDVLLTELRRVAQLEDVHRLIPHEKERQAFYQFSNVIPFQKREKGRC
ncbi:hypothetical protein M3202_10665 [Alkalihalobacillus oceani]|uniref:Uncharacterized protein n=1 Tax=Halalkalibacter oceani TaxID=1653776 RepID=A0A9X2DP69_9BACI|nr:hypothetical protein [Halalkalibacter oceani]MCM3714551.1 hypothetical protein [Halalkalibacter oceani]